LAKKNCSLFFKKKVKKKRVSLMDVKSWTSDRVPIEIRELVDMLGDKRSAYAQTMIEDLTSD
jgi:hypothetical protein